MEAKAAIGTGPFILEDYDKDKQSYKYSANKNYFLGKPVIDTLIFVKSADPVISLKVGDIDEAGLTFDQVQALNDSENIKIVEGAGYWVYRLRFNIPSNSILGNLDVRKAIYHSLDCEDIQNKVLHDLHTISRICDRIYIMYAGRIMETGTKEEILENPRHPYTQKLLSSRLPLMVEPVRIKGIPGSPPSSLKLYQGCEFLERCERSSEICREKKPPDCTGNVRVSCAPPSSKSSLITGNHFSERPSTGTRMTVCPLIVGIVGPNIGCVPRISTSEGANFFIASTGFTLMEVKSMFLLSRFISLSIRIFLPISDIIISFECKMLLNCCYIYSETPC